MSEAMGSFLRRERELRKISLEDLAEQTKIRPEYLRAIESEHFEKMPGLTFVKGYLRAYASGIGLIPEEVVLRFEDYLGRLSGESRQFKKPAKKSLPWLSISFVFLTVLVLIYILWIR